MVFERPGRVVAELGEHLGHRQPGHVLREIEPVRAEIRDDV